MKSSDPDSTQRNSLGQAENADIHEWQEAFLRCVQDPESALERLKAEPRLQSLLRLDTRHRIEVYRAGHYARVSHALAETLFDRASALLGGQVVAGILGRYFIAHPASRARLTDACPDLAAFAGALADVADHGWIPDLLFLCQKHWEALTGPDPGLREMDPALAVLQPAHVFLSSQWSIFDLWNAAGHPNSTGEAVTLDPARPQALLCFKSSPKAMEHVLVPSVLLTFVANLSAGATLLEAIERVPEAGPTEEAIDPASFGRFVAALAARGAFVRRNGDTHAP